MNENALLGQQLTETPEPTTPQSLFVGDTCAPPCWFGLVPGESSSEQVAEFFKNNPDLFSEQWPIKIDGEIDRLTGYLIKGYYSFYWAEDHTPSQLVIPHAVFIHDGVFDQLSIRGINTQITLREMLDILGHPEHMRLWLTPYSAILISAIYETSRIRILLESPDRFGDCTFSEVGTTYTVGSITYFSPDAAQRPVQTTLDNPPQPQLTAYNENDLDIPAEELQRWLNNEETGTCIEVWRNLRDKTQVTPGDEVESER